MTATGHDQALFDRYFATMPVMAIIRGLGRDETLAAAAIAWDAGIDLVEVPIQSPEALRALARLVAVAADRGKIAGAGTVTSVERMRQARDVGAAFTVAPGTDPAVSEISARLGLPHLPGVGSATDVQTSGNLGHRWVKAFPAAQLGSAWIRAMHGPFPGTRFVATGGISRSNARHFLTGGAHAVAFSGPFDPTISPSLIRTLLAEAAPGAALPAEACQCSGSSAATGSTRARADSAAPVEHRNPP